MKRLSKLARQSVPRAGAVALFVFVCAVPLAAQRGASRTRPRDHSGGPAPRRNTPAPPGIREREFILRGMENERNRPRTSEEQTLALAQIAEDYRQIQVINNHMMGAATSGRPLDYKGISEVTAEIRKRALRLRSNIALPEPEEAQEATKAEPPETDAQLVAALRELDRSLMSFVESPIFQNPGVVDAQEAVKAGRHLSNVIELSETVSKHAARMGKAAQKN